MRLLEKYDTIPQAAEGEKGRYRAKTALYCMRRWQKAGEARRKRDYELFWINMFGLYDTMTLALRRSRK